jgi:hypothetical protein
MKHGKTGPSSFIAHSDKISFGGGSFEWIQAKANDIKAQLIEEVDRYGVVNRWVPSTKRPGKWVKSRVTVLDRYHIEWPKSRTHYRNRAFFRKATK